MKGFHCQIVNDHKSLQKEERKFKDIPKTDQVDQAMIQRNFMKVKQDVEQIIFSEKERMLNNPTMMHLVVQK